MGSFGNYWENELLDHAFNKGAYTAPEEIWVALSKADPTDDGSGLSEHSGDAYARAETSAGDWNTASGGVITSAADIEFSTATSDWGTLTHFALYDASSAGNMLGHAALNASRTINNGDSCKFSAGDLSVSLN